jgi:2,4-dienoyl-CoA reductase-like NADH-dependent reductase (Old Yellow Enzyme family)/NADPH-dependent 2,4-dienoyl-CoA reductase/sulfur reductase-like enzyme
MGRRGAGRSGDFGHLLAPGRIGGLDLPNRVVMPAMDMNLCVDGSVTDAEIDHYAARSAGGVGLVITGTGAVSWPVGAASMHQPGFSDDRHIPGMARLADAVHAQGGRVAMQLCHHGKVSTIDMANDRPLLVPSVPVPAMDLSTLGDCTVDEIMGLATASGGKMPTYREATDDDLDEVIDAFAAAARRVKAAGIDAIEIHAAHGYLLSTFLSPGYNHRTDQWGGSVQNRARLTCEVVRAVRAEVGDDYPVLVRINGHEFGPDHGITAHTAAAQAVLIAAAGADAIHVSANAHDPFANFTAGPLPDSVAAYRAIASTVKRALVSAGHNIPVIAVGRLLPEAAEDMLASGDCDFVSMGRQLLADPDLVVHLADDHRAAVRPCINCYVCVEQNFFDLTPRCAVNARLGRGELGGLGDAPVPRSVLVIGGGPAGMEAARVAAGRGHAVTLMEASDQLGGTMRFSSLTTPDNEPMVHWLSHAVADAGVDVQLATRATAATVAAVNPDVVVVATGARRTLGPLEGAATGHGLPRVHTGDDLRALFEGGGTQPGAAGSADASADSVFGRPTRLAIGVGRRLGLLKSPSLVRALSRRWLPLGRRVVVIGGGLVGLELAEFLADRNRQVAVVDAGTQMGLPMALPRRWRTVRHAAGHGIALVRDTTVEGLVPGGVVVRRGERTAIMPADDVVVAEGVLADTALADTLTTAGYEVHVAGDAGGIGYIEGAVRSGYDVGVSL